MGMKTWVVVLIQDFDSAKQRLRPALGNKSRRSLARQNARLAVRAASAGDHVLVVAAAKRCLRWRRPGALTSCSSRAKRARTRPLSGGSNVPWKEAPGQCFFLSSDLPLVTAEGQCEG